jgi:hypothetical protein
MRDSGHDAPPINSPTLVLLTEQENKLRKDQRILLTEELFISLETVKKHIYNAYRKIGVRNRVQLVNAVLEFPD